MSGLHALIDELLAVWPDDFSVDETRGDEVRTLAISDGCGELYVGGEWVNPNELDFDREVLEPLVRHRPAFGVFLKSQARLLAALERGEADLAQLDLDGKTVLQVAAAAGRLPLCNWLLNAGAAVDARGAGGLTALHLAARRGYAELVEELCEWWCGRKRDGGRVDLPDDFGVTPLHEAVLAGHAECVAELLRAGAAPGRATVAARGELPAGVTALELAARNCNTVILGILKIKVTL